MWWIVSIIAVVLVASAALLAYLTAHRLDRLHIRTDLAAAALYEAFLRRHTVAVAIAEGLGPHDERAAEWLHSCAARAKHRSADKFTPGAPQTGIEQAENDLTSALSDLPPESMGPHLRAEATDAGDRLEMARRFYNDAVRDTRRLREKKVVSWFRLAGSAPMPEYIELVDPSYN
jgi:hypothetical protein